MQETLFKTVEFCLQESFKDFESKTFSQISLARRREMFSPLLTLSQIKVKVLFVCFNEFARFLHKHTQRIKTIDKLGSAKSLDIELFLPRR